MAHGNRTMPFPVIGSDWEGRLADDYPVGPAHLVIGAAKERRRRNMKRWGPPDERLKARKLLALSGVDLRRAKPRGAL